MDEVFVIFVDRELSTDTDYQNDGFIIVWDSEEIGRNVSTCELIELIGKYDNDLYCKCINYIYKELELDYGDKPDSKTLDDCFFDEVFEFLEKEIGGGIFYKYHYQTVQFIHRIVSTENAAKELVEYYNNNNSYKKNKYYYTRYTVG